MYGDTTKIQSIKAYFTIDSENNVLRLRLNGNENLPN